jgi:hypothetical protein
MPALGFSDGRRAERTNVLARSARNGVKSVGRHDRDDRLVDAGAGLRNRPPIRRARAAADEAPDPQAATVVPGPLGLWRVR